MGDIKVMRMCFFSLPLSLAGSGWKLVISEMIIGLERRGRKGNAIKRAVGIRYLFSQRPSAPLHSFDRIHLCSSIY